MMNDKKFAIILFAVGMAFCVAAGICWHGHITVKTVAGLVLFGVGVSALRRAWEGER